MWIFQRCCDASTPQIRFYNLYGSSNDDIAMQRKREKKLYGNHLTQFLIVNDKRVCV